MEGYVYLGEYYDILGRPVSPDKKIGKTSDTIRRESELSRTKSPIKYRTIAAFKVDNMDRVESMLHAILDSRRIENGGEFFMDDDDTLTSEFINCLTKYGGESQNLDEIQELETTTQPTKDTRLVDLATKLDNPQTVLIRRYLGVDYEVILDNKGLLHFNGETFDTPNKLYNNGIVKFVKGKKGISGTNQLSQFIIKETGERLED